MAYEVVTPLAAFTLEPPGSEYRDAAFFQTREGWLEVQLELSFFIEYQPPSAERKRTAMRSLEVTHELSTDPLIIEKLPECFSHTQLWQIARLVEAQRGGGAGLLSTTGLNIFYTSNFGDAVVTAQWQYQGGKWLIQFAPTGVHGRFRGDRAFSPD